MQKKERNWNCYCVQCAFCRLVRSVVWDTTSRRLLFEANSNYYWCWHFIHNILFNTFENWQTKNQKNAPINEKTNKIQFNGHTSFTRCKSFSLLIYSLILFKFIWTPENILLIFQAKNVPFKIVYVKKKSAVKKMNQKINFQRKSNMKSAYCKMFQNSSHLFHT